jgi:peptidoglycan/LPS O-acetylase OafA/YrhL
VNVRDLFVVSGFAAAALIVGVIADTPLFWWAASCIFLFAGIVAIADVAHRAGLLGAAANLVVTMLQRRGKSSGKSRGRRH